MVILILLMFVVFYNKTDSSFSPGMKKIVSLLIFRKLQ